MLSLCEMDWRMISLIIDLLLVSRTVFYLLILLLILNVLAYILFRLYHRMKFSYLYDDLHDYQPTRMLRSSTAQLLQRPLVLLLHPVPSPSLRLLCGTHCLLTLVLLTALLALNVDLNLNCLHLLAPLRTVQRHRSAPIRVLCDPVRYINLLVVVVVVQHIMYCHH